MATQIVTFPADSGTAITAQRPDVRLVIPNDGAVYDLSQSRVRVTLHAFNQTGFANYPSRSVVDRRLRFKTPAGTAANPAGVMGRESFVRNVRVSDQKHGVVDLRRHNNTLMSTLNEYQRSRVEKITGGVFDTYAAQIDNFEQGGLFLDKRVYNDPDGTATNSKPRHGVVDIPLSDLTDLARTGESRLWPTALTGETVLELEMEPPQTFVADTVMPESSASMLFVNPTGAAIAVGDTQFRSVDTVDYDANDIYIGMPILIVGQTSIFNAITAAFIDVGGHLNVEIETPLTVAPGANVKIDYPRAADQSLPAPDEFEYVRVELQMVRVMSGSVPRNMSYMSYRLRDLSQSTQTEFSTTVQVPSDRTSNVVIMWKSPHSIQSTCPEAVRYRFSVNDEYEAPPIAFRTSQHHEMIVRGFRNAGMTLRDLNEILPSIAALNDYDVLQLESLLKVIMAPLPLRPPGEPDTVVQLEIEYSAAAAQRLLVYSQQISTLSLSDVGVESGSGPAF